MTLGQRQRAGWLGRVRRAPAGAERAAELLSQARCGMARRGDPGVQGGELPLRERSGGAPPFSTRHGDRSALSHPGPRESNCLAGRVAEVATETEGASGPPPGWPPQLRGPKFGPPRVPCVSLLGHAGKRGTPGVGGVPWWQAPCPCFSRWVAGTPRPSPRDFHFPRGKTWAPSPSRGWGRGREPGRASLGS